MPRNPQGVYTLPAGNPVVAGTLIDTTWANPTMSDIAAALTGSLPRDGSAPMTGPLILSNSTPSNGREAVSKDYVQSFMVYATGMPVGCVTGFAGNTPPAGFLECNGQAVSRTTYADLFIAIGTIYGTGNGTTTFNIPDMRDQFIRGKSDTRAVGSTQAASFASHSHPLSDPTHAHGAFQPAHDHTITTGSHNHTVSDPGHVHSGVVKGIDLGPNIAPGAGWAEVFGNTDAAATGISIASVGNLGGSADARQPAVTVNAAATGISMGVTGGTETVPQNIAQIYVIKALNDAAAISGIIAIDTSDANMIAINETNPAIPVLDIKSNVAFGTVKLNSNGLIPQELVEISTFQYLGPFDASTGQNPSQKFPSEVFTNADLYQISTGGTILLHNAAGVASMTPVVSTDQITYVVNSTVGLPTGWYFQPTTAVTGITAGAVSFVPTGSIGATNVQSAIAEVANESAPLTHVGTGGTQHANAVAAGAAGFMTGADKTKLDGIAANAQVNTVGSVNTKTGAVVLTAADVGAITQAGADALYVNVAGDTMTGPLALAQINNPGNTIAAMTVDAAGKVTFPQNINVRATGVVGASGITASTWIQQNVISVSDSVGVTLSANVLTPSVLGTYLVTVNINQGAGTPGSRLAAAVGLNGTKVESGGFADQTASGSAAQAVGYVRCNGTTDTISAFAFMDTPGAGVAGGSIQVVLVQRG